MGDGFGGGKRDVNGLCSSFLFLFFIGFANLYKIKIILLVL